MTSKNLTAIVVLLSTLASALDIPDGGTDMLKHPFPDKIRFAAQNGAEATQQIVQVEGMDFTQAVRVTSTQRTQKSWDVVLHADTKGDIQRGDVVLLSFWMRTLHSDDESGDGVIPAFFEHIPAPHHKIAGIRATAGKEWRHIVAADVAAYPRIEGRHQVALHLGGFAQTVEIGGLRVINYRDSKRLEDMPYMESTYNGREADAPWRKTAAERIEKHRKADLTMKVTDADGQPVPGAKVSVRMQRHAFDFGSVLNLGAFSLPNTDGEKYREIFEANFTKAPTEGGLRWQNWIRGPEAQRTRNKKTLEDALSWLNERDIEVRGHYLMWAPIEARNKPEELVDKPDELLEALWKHAEEKAKWAGTRVQEWDAINHIAGWGTRFADVSGGNRVYADMIKKGRQWAPHAEMWVNEGQILVGDATRLEEYSDIIRDLIRMEAKPDGIGFMGHFRDTGLPHPEEVYRRIEHFAQFGCKMQLTELDVECGAQEQLQADYQRDVTTIAFSHPGIEAIVLWGFWEGRHWRPSAALWRKDWSIKPAGQAWLDLIQKEWWTNADGETDKQGQFRIRGFLGDYEITVQHSGKEVRREIQLPTNGTSATLVMDRRP